MFVKLSNKTLNGKNKINTAAVKGGVGIWKVIEKQDNVLFSQEKGPWLKIVPLDSSGKELKYLMRWVHLNNDKDFEVIIKD